MVDVGGAVVVLVAPGPAEPLPGSVVVLDVAAAVVEVVAAARGAGPVVTGTCGGLGASLCCLPVDVVVVGGVVVLGGVVVGGFVVGGFVVVLGVGCGAVVVVVLVLLGVVLAGVVEREPGVALWWDGISAAFGGVTFFGARVRLRHTYFATGLPSLSYQRSSSFGKVWLTHQMMCPSLVL